MRPLSIVPLLLLAGCLANPAEVESAQSLPLPAAPTIITLTQTPVLLSIPPGGWAVLQFRLEPSEWIEDDDGSGSYSIRFAALNEGAVGAVWTLRLDGSQLDPMFLHVGPFSRWGLGASTSGGPEREDLVWVIALTPDSTGLEFVVAANNDDPTEGVPVVGGLIANGTAARVSGFAAYLDGAEPIDLEVQDSRTHIATPRGDIIGPGSFTASFVHEMSAPSMHGFDVYIGNTHPADWNVRHVVDGEESSDQGLGGSPLGPTMYAGAAGVASKAEGTLSLETLVSPWPVDNLAALTVPWDPAVAGWTLDAPFEARGNPGYWASFG